MFHVDLYSGTEAGTEPMPAFRDFKTKKKARRYADAHGYTVIVDDNGDVVPAKKTKRELRADLESAAAIISEYKDSVAGAARLRERDRADFQRERDNQDRAMLRAGYIPIKRFRDMVRAPVYGRHSDGGYTEHTLIVMSKPGDVLAGDILTAIITGKSDE